MECSLALVETRHQGRGVVGMQVDLIHTGRSSKQKGHFLFGTAGQAGFRIRIGPITLEDGFHKSLLHSSVGMRG